MSVHRTPISAELPFVLADVKDHIRIDGDTSEDAAIARMAQTAAAEIEHFAQIALLTQTITVTILNPSRGHTLALPIGPAQTTDRPVVTINGDPFSAFGFVAGFRPIIHWTADFQAMAPVEPVIEYTAGFGLTAAEIPHDLAQALLDQAALHYDGRSPMDAKSLTTSPHMARVGARYRGVSL